MKVISTTDVPLQILRELKAELGPEFDLDVDTQVGLHSAEPPSWISLIAESEWWVQALGAYAALYVAEIVKEAGKDTWRNRGKAVAALRSSSDKLKRFASVIARTLSRLRPRTRATVGLPIPDEIYTTQLHLSSADENELAVELAMFVHHLPALAALLEAEGITSGAASGWIGLALLADGSLEVSWFDKKTLDRVSRVIPFMSAP